MRNETQKIAAILTSLACCAGMVSLFPEISDISYAAEIIHNDFEVNYDGWYGNADAVQLVAENNAGYKASRGMTVSGRTSAKDGASSSKGFYLEGGKEYGYSVRVYSEAAEKFHLTLLCIDSETGEATEVELVSEYVKAGKWTKLSASYEAPENSYEFRLMINTDSVNDFTFDDVIITEQKSGNTAYAAPANK